MEEAIANPAPAFVLQQNPANASEAAEGITRTKVNRSPKKQKAPDAHASKVSLPPQAAIWTHSVVELPPIMTKKNTHHMVFDGEVDQLKSIELASP